MAYPKRIRELTEYLVKLPGIGPRQALRLAYALWGKDMSYIAHIADAIRHIHDDTILCALCFRVCEKRNEDLCTICASLERDHTRILVVEKDADLEQFEKIGTYTGTYHVLGGSISSLEKQSAERLRLKELFTRIQKEQTPETPVEVIIATSNNLEGNETATYIERILEPLHVSVTRLGRGLSTGSEIEYADPATLAEALNNRK